MLRGMTEVASTSTKSRLVGLSIVAYVLGVFWMAVGNGIIIHHLAPGENGGHKEFLISLPLAALGSVVAFVIAHRALNQPLNGGAALTLGIMALASLPVFWLALPLILGAPAAYVGWAGRDSSNGSTKSWIGFGLGVVMIVAQVVLLWG